jgi:hypothetical protein
MTWQSLFAARLRSETAQQAWREAGTRCAPSHMIEVVLNDRLVRTCRYAACAMHRASRLLTPHRRRARHHN